MEDYSTSIPSLVNIKLTGELGRRFGRLHQYYIDTPREAIRALAANLGDAFTQFLYDSEEMGLVYRVVVDDPEGIGENQLDIRCQQLVIAPMLVGKGGFGRVLLGAALLAGSFFMPATISIFGMGISSLSVGLLGASLVLGGIHQMLSPQPRTPKKSDIEKTDSFLFSGATQPGQAGQPVPVGYGRVKVGDLILISIGVNTEEIYVPN